MLLLLSPLCLLCSSSSLLSLLLSCLLVTNGRNLRRLFFFLLSAELSETDVDEIDAFVFTCLRCGVGPLPLVVDVCRFGLGVLFVYSSIRLSCRRAADGVVDDAIDESLDCRIHQPLHWFLARHTIGCWLLAVQAHSMEEGRRGSTERLGLLCLGELGAWWCGACLLRWSWRSHKGYPSINN